MARSGASERGQLKGEPERCTFPEDALVTLSVARSTLQKKHATKPAALDFSRSDLCSAAVRHRNPMNSCFGAEEHKPHEVQKMQQEDWLASEPAGGLAKGRAKGLAQ